MLVITPQPASANPGYMESLRRYLRAWPEVDSVQLDGDWVARFNAILGLLQRALLLAAGLLALGVIAVVGNTIRLEIQNRRAEIEVTKLVGGTNGFVRRPFLYTGALYGVLGGLTAWLVVMVAMRLLMPTVAALAQSYGSRFVPDGAGRAGPRIAARRQHDSGLAGLLALGRTPPGADRAGKRLITVFTDFYRQR